MKQKDTNEKDKENKRNLKKKLRRSRNGDEKRRGENNTWT
jgi:hypothetical protein